MISARVYRASGETDVDSGLISRELGANNGLLWVDVVAPTDDDLACLAQEFALHPLAIEDVQHRFQRPKLERYRDHVFIVVYTSQLQEVDFFVGDNWVITVREVDENGDCWDVEPGRQQFERIRPPDCSPGFLVYVLLDVLVDAYFNTTDAFDDRLEALEDRIFREELSDERAVQQELFDVRRELLLFRRKVGPLREVVGVLLRREVPWVDESTFVHLQDVYDHVLRATDLIDSQRELMGNAVEAHLAIISNRMNSVMKTMTSWGAILLGATLVAGIYGMNFRHMPELTWRYGYAWALGIMVAITVVGFAYFRRKDWL
jgi:magnesium transporter